MGTIWYVARADEFEFARYNAFYDYRCSDDWKEKAQRLASDKGKMSEARIKVMLASNDFHCQQNGAETYYDDAKDQYLKSLGLSRDTK